MNRVRCQFRRGENGPLLRAHRYGLGLIPRERKGDRKLRGDLDGELAGSAAALPRGGLHLRTRRFGFELHCPGRLIRPQAASQPTASQTAAIATVSAPGVAESPRGSAMLRSIQPRDALAVSPYHKALFL
jgi:hypothetical protein